MSLKDKILNEKRSELSNLVGLAEWKLNGKGWSTFLVRFMAEGT